MSNHTHLVLTDHESELSDFMEYFNGHLARALNRIDRHRGQVFERRFSPTEIVDDESFEERIVYAVTNPVAANLVESHKDWPGLVAWRGNTPGPIPCQRFRGRDYRRAVAAAERMGTGVTVEREQFVDHAEITFADDDAIDVQRVLEAIQKREAELASDRAGGVLGVAGVLAADPFQRPMSPKRSRMPLCHTSTLEKWFDYRDAWRAFVRAYRRASAAFREGRLNAVFPDHTFRPPLPLRVPIPA